MGDNEKARNRYFAIVAARLGGVVMVLVGILALRDVIALPSIAGYILVGVGIFDVFVVPQLLARKWRTPPENNAGIE